MVSRDSIETAYSFLHQKERVYAHSSLQWQKDDIEVAVADFADQISPDLLSLIADGRVDFLKDHGRFGADIAYAVTKLEQMLSL